MSDRLEAALRELARDVRTPAPDPHLADVVRQRIGAPASTGSRGRVRWIAAAVVALLVSGLAVSPVGAKVAEWLDLGGVMVRDQDTELPGTPSVPSEPSAAATSGATFRPLVPAELGEPDGLSVGADGGLVSMSWTDRGRTIRIDQVDAALDPMFWKSSPDAVHVLVDGQDALWFPSPHELVVTPEGGGPETYPPRLAARTLVVPRGGLTVRIEGDFPLERAVRIAASLE
jgi:hypothetical protein